MKNRNQGTRPPGITVGDILFAIFKHKWLILLCSVLGIGGAAAVFLNQKPLYQSRAKLMVRYIVDSNPADGHETKISTGGRSSASVMQAEIAILTSWDLLMETASAIGVERLIPEATIDQEGNTAAAAVLMVENMQVSTQRGGNVLDVEFVHKDPEVARDVLADLVDRYLEKHLEIHRGGGDFDIVTQQADQVRTQLNRIKKDLQDAKEGANIISLDEATASVEGQRAKIGADFVAATVAFKAQMARVKAYEDLLGIKGDQGKADGPKEDAGPKEDDAAAPPAAAGVHVLTNYRTITSRLAYLENRQFELEMKFKGGALLDLNQKEIRRLKAEMDAMLKAHPGLNRAAGAGKMAGNPGPGVPDLVMLRADLAALQATIEMLQEQEKIVNLRFSELAKLSSNIRSLEHEKGIEETNFENAQISLEKARMDNALDSTRIPNISFIQKPSTPAKTFQGAATKISAGLGLGGIMLGLGLALLLELVVDHRVKRPKELESRFRIPLMMSIPRIGAQERQKALAMIAEENPETGRGLASVSRLADPLAHGGHFINPYADAVRDRLGYYFELNNMTHKPKLIALAGLSAGAGTTTIAAGLAAAFAEIDDSTVLYLDMNSFQGGGDADEDPDALNGALTPEREYKVKSAGGNLYVATVPAGAAAGSKRLAAKKFYDLMPKFRASHFDYIIFDMPPLGATSPTTAMTGFMDQVILVLDAQNTDRDLLQQGYADLARGNADVTCIFNKAKSQAPRWIQGAA